MTAGSELEAQLPVPRRRWRGRVRALALDVSPLRRSPPYRRLWAGQLVSVIGAQLTLVAVPVQVYGITHSSFAVGLLGLAALLPLIVFGLYGGAIADSMDRRRVLLATQLVLAGSSVLLMLLAVSGSRAIWPLYAVVAIQGAGFAVDTPARRSIIPRLLPPELIPAANALSQVSFNVGLVAGPLLAGLLIGELGLGWAYALDAATYGASFAAAWTLPALRPEGGGRPAGWASVVEGLRFLASRRVLLMTFVVDINAMVFGMPRALFPALALERFHGGARTVGLLYSGVAIGALLGALFGGWFGRVRRQGRAVVLAIVVWGIAIAGFGLTRTLGLAVVLLAVAGAGDMVSAVFRTTILQTAAPDAMLGRLNGVFIVVVAGGPRLGDLEAGAVAALVSPQFSVVSGGLACIAGVVLLAALVPSFVRYDARDPTP
ncbi:MAG: MFS transporter [Mycobacteriales bacterium]|nr:MFS transporter [Frankia sp.]